MSFKPKDYAFLKILFENDGEVTTREMRQESERDGSVVSLDNSDINYRIDKFGDGNSNVSGKGMVKTKRQKSVGSEPKKIVLKENRKGDVQRILEDYNPSASTEDFSSVQEAINFLIEQTDEVRERSESNEENMEEMIEMITELKNTVDELEQENSELQSTVESQEEQIQKFKDDVVPLVKGMAGELQKRMDFDPNEYI